VAGWGADGRWNAVTRAGRAAPRDVSGPGKHPNRLHCWRRLPGGIRLQHVCVWSARGRARRTGRGNLAGTNANQAPRTGRGREALILLLSFFLFCGLRRCGSLREGESRGWFRHT